jgi:SAM-dependent methyltransferase
MLDKNFWNNRWLNNQTGWDIGFPSPAIIEYFKQYTNKQAKILIPGCGNAYEAEYLVENGYNNITLLDIAPKAAEILKEKFKNKPQVNIICGDFFQHNEKYDIIIEQTFFCTLYPENRNRYIEAATTLLNTNGKIIGLLFNKIFEQDGPPFGGNKEEYQQIFKPNFTIKTMNLCYNSILPRSGSELFITLIKK